MTVTGPVEADQLGFTLVHEHVYYGPQIETGDEWNKTASRSAYDPDLLYDQLMLYKNAGGVTLVDQTTGGLRGKNGDILLDQEPYKIKHSVATREMSERTGLNIVLGTGWYRVPFYEPYLYEIKTNDLADELIRDITVGLHGTDVKAGLLGEIGVEHPSWIWPVEERMLRAVARAHHETGVTIATHAVGGPVGLRQLDILMDEGVEPHRVIIGHVSLFHSHDYHAEIARRGAFMAFDTIKGGEWKFRNLQELVHIMKALDAGLIDHVMLSQDNAMSGGGYEHISTTFKGYLRDRGVTDEQYDRMTVDNPRRALTGEF